MKINKATLVLCMIFAVSGCQSTPSEPVDSSQTTNDTVKVRSFQSIQSVYSQWEVELQEHAQLSIYDPNKYNRLLEAWDDVDSIYAELLKDETLVNNSYSMFSSLTYAEAFDEKIALVKSDYDSIQELKKNADRVLADSIEQMDYLTSLRADTLFTSSYKRLYSEYRELFEYVQEGELEDAQEAQVEFLNEAHLLELKVAHKTYIEPLKDDLAFLKNEDFDDVVPLTFAKATSQIALTESQVKANPRETSMIEDAVQAAEFELKHVRNVAHEVKILASVNGDKFEQSVLKVENQLLSISKAVNGDDYRDVGLRLQFQQVLDSVNAQKSSDLSSGLKSENEALTKQLTQLETDNQQQVKKLSDATKRNELLEKQIARSDAHIKSLEDLVDNLRASDVQLAAESDSQLTPSSVKPNPEATTSESSSEEVTKPSEE